jgi:hypothetical protein
MDKARIIDLIKSTAEGGEPLGERRFQDATGISRGKWRGKFWGTWSEALTEAGFAPNRASEAHTREALLAALISLVKRIGRFPTYADLRLAKQADDSFPNHQGFLRLGSVAERIALIREHVAQHEEHRGVLDLLPTQEDAGEPDVAEGETSVDGSVYMLKLGKHFKIGKTFSVPRRHREIALELPEKPDVVHVITTDDPTGIEAYWHARFAAKRTNGEWFALTRDDVRAFKRRKFM